MNKTRPLYVRSGAVWGRVWGTRLEMLLSSTSGVFFFFRHGAKTHTRPAREPPRTSSTASTAGCSAEGYGITARRRTEPLQSDRALPPQGTTARRRLSSTAEPHHASTSCRYSLALRAAAASLSPKCGRHAVTRRPMSHVATDRWTRH
jgi:hypothetical protein